MSNHPAGTSAKNLHRWIQLITNKEYQMFDYGPEKNLEIYKSERPYKYDLSKINFPIALIEGSYDKLVN
jgi:hypothetical protein